ncbi:hypothetical protein HWI79_2626 [Cryptosporidium felis]|nr:hypothetical protein HWI79_2626 [Cryptosporidium felis]
MKLFPIFIYIHILIFISLHTPSYAEYFPDFTYSILPYNQYFNNKTIKVEQVSTISKGTLFHGDDKFLLVMIQEKNNQQYYPFTGTFSITKDCQSLKIIFYDINETSFVLTTLSCNNRVRIFGKFGKIHFIPSINHTQQNHSIFKRKKFKQIKIKLVIRIQKYKISKAPRLSTTLQKFHPNLIPKNFNPETDQIYPKIHSQLTFKGYINTSNKNLISSSKITPEFSFAIFKSQHFNYAFPIHQNCQCIFNTIKNETLDCNCSSTNYSYDIRNGILHFQDIKILTNNIGGLRVIITKTLDTLIQNVNQALHIIDQLNSNNNYSTVNTNNITLSA